MPRDMRGSGRYAPHPKYQPFAFYSCVRLGDPEMLQLIMDTDPYFITQDNGAGAPIHFAVTYKQLDMIHHLLNNGAEINQRDNKGFTPLHRAAYLAHYEGYLEIYEYLLSRGADPCIRTEDYDPYLDPGCKLPVEVATPEIREKLIKLEEEYAKVPKKGQPHEDIGCWWTLYDYGLDAVKQWNVDYKPVYPEEKKRQLDQLREKQAKQSKQLLSSNENILQMKNTPVAFLFPGQGSQSVGMIQSCADIPAVKSMLQKAKEILGYDLLDVCINGPKERLDDTVYSQPAMFVGSLAAIEKLRQDDPALVDQCSATAGLSVGEYAALVFAGVMSFEEGLKVVKVRAESMSAAAKEGKPHGMLSIVGLSDQQVQSICDQVKQKMGEDTVCQIANYLFPQGRVISGHIEALEQAEILAKEQGALKAVRVAVSGGFHTSLMLSAKQNLMGVLEQVNFKQPKIPVYSNVTAKPFEDAQLVPDLLGRQLVEPVRWQDILQNLIGQGKNKFVELGPGQQVKAMVKRMDVDAWKAFKVVNP
eukprot:TRINITY_DN5308_c1_g1_i2.p2 TRINITY_DN5308_c1_g1~~TRINITY_DN5308_c1_g1_i2.p2  ORF type:complete len:531 (+),score=73.37 TRINITY_DN5308_c1_g1_i2:121-1713(+)